VAAQNVYRVLIDAEAGDSIWVGRWELGRHPVTGRAAPAHRSCIGRGSDGGVRVRKLPRKVDHPVKALGADAWISNSKVVRYLCGPW